VAPWQQGDFTIQIRHTSILNNRLLYDRQAPQSRTAVVLVTNYKPAGILENLLDRSSTPRVPLSRKENMYGITISSPASIQTSPASVNLIAVTEQRLEKDLSETAFVSPPSARRPEPG